MPFTAKFSERFYEKLGHDVVNELVDWVNTVDLTYRTELREQNEINFQRFVARLDQRFAEAEAKIESVRADLLKWMIGFWATTILTMIGTGAAVVSLLR